MQVVSNNTSSPSLAPPAGERDVRALMRGGKMGMALSDGDLLPGEHHVKTKFANMVISVKESGLSRFAFDKYMGLVGMKGKEAIGGKAHLTNYRIIFKSHFFNRVRGKHSIFLPNVTEVSATFNNLIVETAAQRFEFVMWFKQGFIDAVNHEKESISPAQLEKLKKAVVSYPAAIGIGLQKWATLEIINQVCLGAQKASSVLENLSGTEKNAFLEILELFQPT